MSKIHFLYLPIVIVCVFISSCEKSDKEIKEVALPLFYIPDGFPNPSGQLQNNPVTTAGFALGRKLFYDPILSKDSTVNCSTCHQQFGSFSQVDHSLSHGVNNLLGTRNSPALINLAWHSEFFWDGGSNHIEVQPIAPITNPVEMHETLSNVIYKLNRSSTYPSLFRSAYGSDTITSQGILRALAQFMSCLISANSKYDQVRNGKAFFTATEDSGYTIFKSKCTSCHKEPLLTDLTYRNNGLDAHFADAGRARITTLATDSGKFKVPTLRNIVLSYPYMHDGRLNTLSKVIDHYRSTIVLSSTIDPSLSSGNMSITDAEKAQLLAFLSTLTDQTFITDKRFSAQ